MSLSSLESSGDASLPSDTIVAILSRNLDNEAQQELPPTPTGQQRLLIPANNDSGDNVQIQVIFW